MTLSAAFIAHNFFEVGKAIINMEIFVVESLMNVIFVCFLLLSILIKQIGTRVLVMIEWDSKELI